MQMQSNLSSFSWFARKRLAQERWGGIGPLLARAGRREDYRNRDEWGYPTAPNASWQDRIGALMPVSYSGIILLICILVFLLSLVARGFVYDYLVLIPHFVVERPWTILTHMFVHFSFDHLFFNMLFLFFFGMELERRVGGESSCRSTYCPALWLPWLRRWSPAVQWWEWWERAARYSALWDVWP